MDLVFLPRILSARYLSTVFPYGGDLWPPSWSDGHRHGLSWTCKSSGRSPGRPRSRKYGCWRAISVVGCVTDSALSGIPWEFGHPDGG